MSFWKNRSVPPTVSVRVAGRPLASYAYASDSLPSVIFDTAPAGPVRSIVNGPLLVASRSLSNASARVIVVAPTVSFSVVGSIRSPIVYSYLPAGRAVNSSDFGHQPVVGVADACLPDRRPARA